MTTPAVRSILFKLSAVLAASALLLLAGCGTTLNWPKNEVRVSTKQQSSLLAKADQAMQEGRYDAARQAYAELLAADAETVSASIARYGLACIALIRSQDAGEFDQSLDLFLAWAKNDPSAFYNGDPRHLVPLLKKHQTALQNLKRSKQRIAACQEENDALDQEYELLEQRRKALEERTAFLEQRRAALKGQLKALSQENRALRKKINELEELYNEMQTTRENL